MSGEEWEETERGGGKERGSAVVLLFLCSNIQLWQVLHQSVPLVTVEGGESAPYSFDLGEVLRQLEKVKKEQKAETQRLAQEVAGIDAKLRHKLDNGKE